MALVELPRVAGLDLSLTAPAVAMPDGTVATIKVGKLRGIRRVIYISDQVLELASNTIDLAVIEGYSHASKHQQHQLGELGGVVRADLERAGCWWLTAQPSTVKKLATGKGQADKIAMVIAARERLGYPGQSHDEADALWCRELGLHLTSSIHRTKLPKTHLAALDKLELPPPPTT